MTLHPIDVSVRAPLEQLYQQYGHRNSAHHFSSLYVWRHEMQLSVLWEPDLFAVKAGWRGQDYWFFPCGEAAAKKRFLLSLADSSRPRLCYACSEDVAFAEKYLPGVYRFSHTPEDDEYLYDRGQQIAMAGKAFRHQRNALNRVTAAPSLSVRPLADDTLPDALSVLSTWSQKSHDMSVGGLIGCQALEVLLRSYAPLCVTGVVVYDGGVPCALAAGYELAPDCFDLSACIQSVGNSDYSIYARHCLLRQLPEQVRIVNAEEDLGLSGLRTVKQGMKPCSIIHTYEGRIL